MRKYLSNAKVGAMSMLAPLSVSALYPSVAHAAKLSDWFGSWQQEILALWPIINIACIVIGLGFAAVGVVGYVSAKKNNQPAGGWPLWFIVGGVVLTVLFAFVGAVGGSLTGESNAVESSASQWNLN